MPVKHSTSLERCRLMCLSNIRGRLRYYHGVMTQNMTEFARERYQQFEELLYNLESHTGEIKGRIILDIGCGRMYPYTLLFHSLGNTVIGIDTTYIGYNDPLYSMLRKELRSNGLASFMRTLQLKIQRKGRDYYQALQQCCNFPLNTKGLTIECMSAEEMTFPDRTFDIVVSNVIFEHISDVPKAISEIYRVLADRGINHNVIHLFTSWSGGHQLDYTESKKVPPWDHLRLKRYPAPVYLNKVRMHEYISLFQEKFKILKLLKVEDERARDLLTPEIRAQLADYTEEELLTQHLIIIAQK